MRACYTWTRDLHLYAGFLLCPFILLFAISTLRLNHPGQPGAGGTSAKAAAQRSAPVEIPDGVGTLENAKEILRQLRVTGEIDYVRHNAKAERLLIPVSKPGETTRVEVDLRARVAMIERQERGLVDALVYLHRMPGPHNVRFRGNWTYMIWWGVTADVVVYGILFLTVSGLYLWWMARAERRAGWMLLGGGAGSLALLVAAIVTA